MPPARITHGRALSTHRLPLVPVILAALAALATTGGCAASLVGRWTLPDRYAVAREQLLIHSDFPLPQHHRIFDDLAALRGDLGRRLALVGTDEPIHVYLFESPERFKGFMRLHHPEFPDRRAFFVETDTRLAVYARWGDRMAEDLRHEVTHAYLHAAVPRLPLWLDEGLAEFYEAPRGQRGVNRSHVERLMMRLGRGQWEPDMARLERLDPTQDMNQDDYAESWAWVHFLLDSRPECLEVLRSYLGELCRDGPVEPLAPRLRRLSAHPEWELVEHVRALAAGAR